MGVDHVVRQVGKLGAQLNLQKVVFNLLIKNLIHAQQPLITHTFVNCKGHMASS